MTPDHPTGGGCQGAPVCGSNDPRLSVNPLPRRTVGDKATRTASATSVDRTVEDTHASLAGILDSLPPPKRDEPPSLTNAFRALLKGGGGFTFVFSSPCFFYGSKPHKSCFLSYRLFP